MRIDAYTKTLLTIIALGLMWLCVRATSLLADAHAQPAVQAVKIVGIELGEGVNKLPISLQEIYVPNPYSGETWVRAVPIGGTVTCKETP
jgi:hypothetical protein